MSDETPATRYTSTADSNDPEPLEDPESSKEKPRRVDLLITFEGHRDHYALLLKEVSPSYNHIKYHDGVKIIFEGDPAYLKGATFDLTNNLIKTLVQAIADMTDDDDLLSHL